MATPGHTSDSTSLLVSGPTGRWLLTGDMVLGRGTTVITHPDGDLGAYLSSLEVLLTLVREHEVTAILPGHGPVVTDPEGVLTFYREHRQQRLDQVRAALRQGDTTPARGGGPRVRRRRSLRLAGRRAVRAGPAGLPPRLLTPPSRNERPFCADIHNY